MKTQNTTTKFNKSEIFKAAWSLVRACSLSISEALSLAWNEAKSYFSVSTEKIAAFANSLDCCSAWVNGTKSVEVTYRAKRGDRVYVDMMNKTVEFSTRAVAQVAGQIAKEFNFTLNY